MNTQRESDARIALLPDTVVDKIAAGEVIERPASVVKELVENALDAGATTIEVRIEDGGLGRIVVSDDGQGMGPVDLERSIIRHATSKLRQVEDLLSIGTYGFRGEALAAIGAVSKLAITTRRAHDDVGICLRVEGGRVESMQPVACAIGTTMDVAELFYNTPARRKFLRSAATEQAHAVEAAQRVVLGRSNAGLVVATGEMANKRLFDLRTDAVGSQRFVDVLRPKSRKLYEFGSEIPGVIAVRGYVGAAADARPDTRGVWLFANGRFVRDRLLQRAVLEAFRPHIGEGAYPLAAVFVDVAPERLDVNVHPQKLEVRFADSSFVFQSVQTALSELLQRAPWQQPVLFSTPVRISQPQASSYVLRPETSVAPAPSPLVQSPLPMRAQAVSNWTAKELTPVGIAWGTNLVGSCKQGLIIGDARALWQRWALGALEREPGRPRALLLPSVVVCGEAIVAWLEHGEAILNVWGVVAEPLSKTQAIVRAVPESVAELSTPAFCLSVLQQARSREGGVFPWVECVPHLTEPSDWHTPAQQERLWSGLSVEQSLAVRPAPKPQFLARA